MKRVCLKSDRARLRGGGKPPSSWVTRIQYLARTSEPGMLLPLLNPGSPAAPLAFRLSRPDPDL